MRRRKERKAAATTAAASKAAAGVERSLKGKSMPPAASTSKSSRDVGEKKFSVILCSDRDLDHREVQVIARLACGDSDDYDGSSVDVASADPNKWKLTETLGLTVTTENRLRLSVRSAASNLGKLALKAGQVVATATMLHVVKN